MTSEETLKNRRKTAVKLLERVYADDWECLAALDEAEKEEDWGCISKTLEMTAIFFMELKRAIR